jgi:hypothetical protein
LLDDPTPLCFGNAGCPAMVRRGAGQWTSCGADPVAAGYVGCGQDRHRVFPCAAHRQCVDDLQPLTEDDRAEVQRRRDAYWQMLELQVRNRHESWDS